MRTKEELRGQIEERLLAMILRANRARIYEDLLRHAEVRIDKALYPVLSATAALAPARVSEIATAVALNPTTASRHLSSLERLGLVERSASPTDGRAAIVALTDAGTRTIGNMRRARSALFADLLADFDRDELERFNSYLARLIAAFEAAPDARAASRARGR